MAECSHCGSASSCSSAGTNGPCPSQMIAQQDKQIEDRLSHIKHKIFVMSGKGGVGKSSVAVNVACALVKLGYKVGLLDVDIHGPSVPNLLGMKSTNLMVNEQGLIIPAMWQDKMEVISMDTLLGEDRDQAIIWRGPKKTGAIRQFISDVAWGNLDFLVIDSPPGTGDEHMTILQAIPDAIGYDKLSVLLRHDVQLQMVFPPVAVAQGVSFALQIGHGGVFALFA